MRITLNTKIEASIGRVFDLARSIDLHIESSYKTKEKAIAGRTSGLIEYEENVRWRAQHFGVWFELESTISQYDRPNSFTDEMLDGPFKYLRHRHSFVEKEGFTIMSDTFEFESPFGKLGSIVDRLFMKGYMTNFLEERNMVIKAAAERDSL